ncbi:hypothetical protein AB0L53_03585 [Nonomuraea sp. NPDC052129]|uniref:hypothetical protein n=1 Tax=Nonomuraea sp. NPDC052129 TaxID=3154651 RepID=UPI00341DED17
MSNTLSRFNYGINQRYVKRNPAGGQAIRGSLIAQELRPMDDAKTATPEPTIPGWRLILSDRGRFWAVRREAFPPDALRAGAEPTVDADTFDALKVEVARQEEIAERVVS